MDLLYIKELHFFLFPACNWKKKRLLKKELKSSKQRMGRLWGRKISVKLYVYVLEPFWIH